MPLTPHFELGPKGGWHAVTAPKFTTDGVHQRGVLFRCLKLVGKLLAREDLPVLFAALYHHPRLFWAWLFFASRLMPYGNLPAQLRERVILRTAWNCRCRYEWGQHVDIALNAGLTDEDICALTRAQPDDMDPVEAAVLRACDEFQGDGRVSDATWEALSRAYSQKDLVELTMLIGHYLMLAGFINSAGLSLEEPIEARLQAFHQRIARRSP